MSDMLKEPGSWSDWILDNCADDSDNMQCGCVSAGRWLRVFKGTRKQRELWLAADLGLPGTFQGPLHKSGKVWSENTHTHARTYTRAHTHTRMNEHTHIYIEMQHSTHEWINICMLAHTHTHSILYTADTGQSTCLMSPQPLSPSLVPSLSFFIIPESQEASELSWLNHTKSDLLKANLVDIQLCTAARETFHCLFWQILASPNAQCKRGTEWLISYWKM
jgi:hypothetical protein